MDYVEYQRRKWERAATQTLRQQGVSILNGYAPSGARFGLGAVPTPPRGDTLKVTAAEMAAAQAEVQRIYGGFNVSRSGGDMKAFAAALRQDVDLIRKSWPATEHCISGAALRQLTTAILDMNSRIVNLANSLASEGVRRLNSEQYRNTAAALQRDAVGIYGFGPLLSALGSLEAEARSRGASTDAVTLCIPRGGSGGDVRQRVLFVLERQAIALGSLAYLEDIRPWFARGGVADAAWGGLFTAGKVAYVIAKKLAAATGAVLNTIGDMFDLAAKFGKYSKWILWGSAGVLALWLATKFRRS